MSKPPANELRESVRAWVRDVEGAKRGDIGPLIEALHSDRPIGLVPGLEKYVREAVAGMMAGEPKRSRGRRKLSDIDIVRKQYRQAGLIVDVDRLHIKMIRARVKDPLRKACDHYAKQRGNVTGKACGNIAGKTILRYYRTAKRDPVASKIALELAAEEKRLRLESFPPNLTLGDLVHWTAEKPQEGRRKAAGNGEFK